MSRLSSILTRNWLFVAVLVIAPFAPLFTSTERMKSNLVLITVYVVLANSMALLFRNARLLPIMHGALMGVGAYTAAIASDRWDVGFWGAIPMAAALSALVGGAVAYPAFRTKGFYLFMVTFAAAEFFVLLADNFDSLTGGVNGMVVTKRPSIFGLNFDNRQSLYELFLAFAILSVVIIWALEKSPFGRRVISVRDNEPLAESLGTNTRLYKVFVFMISASMAGVAGVMWLYHLRSINPDMFGGFASFVVIEMVIIGGVGTLVGPTVGALLFVLLPEKAHVPPDQQPLLFGAVLIFVVVMMPAGLGPGVQDGVRNLLRIAGNLIGGPEKRPREVPADESEPFPRQRGASD